ncbi:MAG: substrate-binding domain-containing protein [Neomegalonema sp.]|nr:substrate-binding domain-containing protein [Neomegalonema sp.]
MTRFGLIAAAAAVAVTGAAHARDTVKIAGSSTVLPYARIVAKNFGEENPEYKTVVESGGSSAGIKEFCKGVGTQYIDIANSSRAMKSSEVKACASKGVTDIIEIKFGYDGIVFAYDAKGPKIEFEPIDIYRALAKEIVKDGKIIANPNKTMKDVQGEYPAWKIAFFVPASNHGTREVFEVKVLEKGCKDLGDYDVFKKEAEAKGLKGKKAKKAAFKRCVSMRTDGSVTEIAGDYTETLAGIKGNKTGFGVFGLAFYENNKDTLRVAPVSGVVPTAAAVASGKYPVSRPLYFYVKKAHLGVIKGMKEYVEFFISEAMTGPKSPTVAYGLVAAPKAEREATRAKFAKESK